MAVEREGVMGPEAAPAAVRPGERPDGPVSVTDADARGVAGFADACRSLAVGLGITGGHALTEKPRTVRYPRDRVDLSPRWRGALRLRGILGRDDIPVLDACSTEYNKLVDDLYARDRLAPCVGNCPANVDARGQNFHLAEGRFVEAYELVRSRNLMPGVLGRICHHPCESACRRNHYDQALAIRPLHRIAYEEYQRVRAGRHERLPVTKDQHVAIVGSGPSGLTAAHDLMRLGYPVTVYEKDAEPGGALGSGVPPYRLPRDVLRTEIGDLVEMGLDLRCGIRIGTDVPLDHLIGEYDAVLIAAGLQDSRVLPIPGSDAEGVRGALEFLREANWNGEAGVRGRRVMVIGGGNVAVDVARCALRVGASEVRLACLEADDEMPCHPWEIEEGVDEGVIAMCSLGPEEVLTQDGRVTGIRMRECLQVFDAQGRFAPVFGTGQSVIPCEVVVFSVGQSADLSDLVGGTDLLLDERGNLPVDGTYFTTAVPGVFACGEVVTGPGSCVGSIATGHEAATSMHRYLEGVDIREHRVARPVPFYGRYAEADLEGVESSRLRVTMPLMAPETRRAGFDPVEMGMTRLEALLEAARCLRCQSEVCVGCTFCARVCPDYALKVERVDDPGARCVTKYELDLTKCCFCGLCAEQCPTDALTHTGHYELSFYDRGYMVFDREEMLRSGGGTRATGADSRSNGLCTGGGGGTP